MKQWSMFIGRWQPWHKGHRWLIDQRLNEGKNVWVAIRDVEKNENQPWSSFEVLQNVSKQLEPLISEGKVMVSIIPDIESINYGRGVGYKIEQESFDSEIESISATKIRQKLREEGKL